ncbi:MAG: OmpA family protein [Candidatus Kapaibacterium sp.]
MKQVRLFILTSAMVCLMFSPMVSKSTPLSLLVKAIHESQVTAVKPELFLMAAIITEPPQSAMEEDENVNILNTDKIRIINLGKVINHENVDYAPTVSADGKTLFYVSNRPGSIKKSSGDLSHDFWASKKASNLDTNFSDPYNIDLESKFGDLSVNTTLNEGAASIAADRQTLVFTGCNRSDGLGDCDLYITEIDGDKWSKPKNLGKNVNSSSWDSQPSIAPDKSRIYFSSNRPGPNGSDNFDIWYSDYDFDLEDWKPAVNMTGINTGDRERAPFIAADNTTLFFSSDGHSPNLGGLDFYSATNDNGKWSKPQHLGTRLNTSEDEEFITLPASGDVIYFSSRRSDLKGYQGSLDVFMAFVPSFFKAVILSGVVLDECTDENIPASISVRNTVTGKVFKDTLNTSSKKEFQLIISNTDFGNPKDSIKSADFEIIATNPTYGETKKVVTIDKPKQTKDRKKAEEKNEVKVTLKLGQRPVIGAEMEFSDFIKRASKKDPSLSNWKGLVMEEVKTRELYPLLNYVFFDEGSAEFPKRYIMFDNAAKTASFNDEAIPGGTLEKYYNVLNIYGYRLKKYPNVKVEILGCFDNAMPTEKSMDLAQKRADIVYNYLKNIWGIAENRLTKKAQGYSKLASKTGDPDPQSKTYAMVENRRSELWFSGDPEDVWQVMKPILDIDPKIFPSPLEMNFTMKNGIEEELVAARRIEVKRGGQLWNTLSNVGLSEPTAKWNWENSKADELSETVTDETPFEARLIVTSKRGMECISDPISIKVKIVNYTKDKIPTDGTFTREKYNLILFPFDRFDAGPFNERILKEFVYPRCASDSKIGVDGHTDVVGMFDYNQKLSGRRAETVKTGINSFTGGKYNTLDSKGDGEENPLFDNSLPEGRMYNRTVQINISTPIKDE